MITFGFYRRDHVRILRWPNASVTTQDALILSTTVEHRKYPAGDRAALGSGSKSGLLTSAVGHPLTYCGAVTSFLRTAGFRRSEKQPIHQITGARRGVRDDVNSRTRRYLASMGVRTVCFLLAVVTEGWLRWVMIAAAVVLPYVSVVFANAGREGIQSMPVMAPETDRKAIDGPARP